MGELLTCPFCLGPMGGHGPDLGLVLGPPGHPLVAALFTSLTVDLLQFGYDKVQQEVTG